MSKIILFLAIFFCNNCLLSGQSGILKKASQNLIKKETEDSKQATTPATKESKPSIDNKPSPTRSREEVINQRETNSTSPTKTKVPKEQPIPDLATSALSPAIAWYSLLDDNLFGYIATDGYFRPSGIEVYFLPEKDTKGMPMNYNSFEDGIMPSVSLKVRDTKTQEIKGQFFFRAEPYTLPAYKLKFYENALNSNTPPYIHLLEGSYSFDFYLGDQLFYKFPIRIDKELNKDPYAPVKQWYWMRGEWEEWGRVGYNSSDEIIFGMYLPERNIKVESQAKWDDQTTYPYYGKLLRNGTLVGLFDIETTYKQIPANAFSENGKWHYNQNHFFVYPPRKKSVDQYYDRTVFVKADLKDGNYTVETELHKPLGIVKEKYAFAVKGGEILSDPRTDRSKYSDPMTIVEQGPTIRYIKKLK